ncbi:MAG TPA: T9SS type A sorting domain-containing protein [Rhodothermales bacterium]|nr:T9SS type A sorting domain-containing protein [Rhodothermales bacterium]
MATPRRVGAALFLALLLASAQTVAAQGTASFSNTTPILLPGTGTAAGNGAPYPSDITVGGMSGVISDVNVTIRDFSHMWPQDVDVLLVSPGGTNIIVMSDVIAASASQPISNRTYVFDDAGGLVLTTAGAAPSGVYRPSPGGLGDVFPAPAPTASAATALASFNGQSPNGVWSLYALDDTGGDIGAINGGWSIEITTVAAAGSNAVFSVGPNGINFANAGACTLPGIRRTVTLTMSNSGTGGTVNVLGAVTTGSSAFSIELVSPVPPTFPVALSGVTTSAIAVAFQPTALQTGPQSGTLDISYNIDGGPTLVRSIPFSGQGDAEGAGYVFRSSVVDPACAPGAGTPGTAFVIPTTNTRVTAFTSGNANDGRFNLDLATTYGASFPSFRMFGIDRTVLQLITNGLMGVAADLSPTSTFSTTFYGALPASGLHSIQVAAMNLNMDATVAADNLGVLGAPGLFHGLADVDSDGDQDLVITWWHAYDNGSVPGPSGEYLTAQLILLQANANQEDIIEMRFLDGNDGNAVPFRQNTAVTSTDNSMENDAMTGIGEFYALESAIYRLRNGAQNAAAATMFGGPLYSSGSVGVRFQPETQATATGQAGWRMLGAPARYYQVHRLAQLNLVQGIPGGGFPAGSTNAQTFPGQYPTYGANLYSSYSGTGYVTPTNTAAFLTSGQGFLWYLYNQSFDPADVDGTSNSYALPMALQGTGPEAGLDFGSASAGVTVHANGNGWNMLANPFRDDLNITNIASWARGGTLASAVGQIWNPNAGGSGSYVLTTSQSNQLSAWQGVMIQNNTAGGATSLTIPTPRFEGAPFVGRAAPPRMLAFALSGTSTDGSAELVDQAAMLYFAEDATAGWDLLDAGKLTPLATSFATIAFQGERNGNAVLKAQDSRPYDAGAFEVPMAVTAVGTAPELTLSWPTLDGIPATWSLVLRDLVTGAEINLRQQSTYTFTVASARAADLVNGMPPVGAAEARLADSRFVLVVNGATTGTGGSGSLPTVFALHNIAPNPIVGVSAALQYDLPEAAATRIELYDMLGRLVATVVDGAVEAGRHTARLDASALASGSYVIRMTAGSFVQAQRVTVTR